METSFDRRLSPPNSPVVAYGLAVVAVAAAGLLATVPILGQLPFTTFLFALALVSWCLGRGPALLASMVACGILAYFFLPPDYSLRVDSPSNRLQLAIFGLAGLAMSVLAQWYSQPVGVQRDAAHEGRRGRAEPNPARDA